MTPWYPSLWAQVGSSIIVVVCYLPFVLAPLAVVRRAVKGQW